MVRSRRKANANKPSHGASSALVDMSSEKGGRQCHMSNRSSQDCHEDKDLEFGQHRAGLGASISCTEAMHQDTSEILNRDGASEGDSPSVSQMHKCDSNSSNRRLLLPDDSSAKEFHQTLTETLGKSQHLIEDGGRDGASAKHKDTNSIDDPLKKHRGRGHPSDINSNKKTADSEEEDPTHGSLFLTRLSGEDTMWKAYRQNTGKENIIKVIRTCRVRDDKTKDVTDENKSPGTVSTTEPLKDSQSKRQNPPDFYEVYPDLKQDKSNQSGQYHALNDEPLNRNKSKVQSTPSQSECSLAQKSLHDLNECALKQNVDNRRTRGEILKMKRKEMAEHNPNFDIDTIPSWLTVNVEESDMQSFQNAHECNNDGHKYHMQHHSPSDGARHIRNNSESDESNVSDRTSAGSKVSIRLIDHLQMLETNPEENEPCQCHPIDKTTNHCPRHSKTNHYQATEERDQNNKTPCYNRVKNGTHVTDNCDHGVQKSEPSLKIDANSSKNVDCIGGFMNRQTPLQSQNALKYMCGMKTACKSVQVDFTQRNTRDSSCQYSPVASLWSHQLSDLSSVSTNASTVCSKCKRICDVCNNQMDKSQNKRDVSDWRNKLSVSCTTISEYVSDKGYTVWETPCTFRVTLRNGEPHCSRENNSDVEMNDSVASFSSMASGTRYEDVNTCCCHNRTCRRMFRRESPPPTSRPHSQSKSDASDSGECSWKFDRLEHIHRTASSRTKRHCELNYNHSSLGNINVNSNANSNQRHASLMSGPSDLGTGLVSDMSQFQKLVEDAKMKTHSNADISNSAIVPDTECKDPTSTFIGNYLYNLWKHQCLCDVQIRVGSTAFMAHKIVLAAFSDVFCPTTPQPVAAVSFEVPDTSPDAVFQVFNYLYTSCMELKDDLLEPIMSAALFMGICEIVDIVKEILSRPTMDNMELYGDIKRNFGMTPTITDYLSLLENNFMDMIETKTYMELAAKDIEQMLQDPDVLVESELDTIKAIANWVEFNPMCRMDYLPKLLSRVNFECIKPETIAVITKDYAHIFGSSEVQRILSNAYRFHALKNIPGTEGLIYEGADLKGGGARNGGLFNETRKDFVNKKSDDGGGYGSAYDMEGYDGYGEYMDETMNNQGNFSQNKAKYYPSHMRDADKGSLILNTPTRRNKVDDWSKGPLYKRRETTHKVEDYDRYKINNNSVSFADAAWGKKSQGNLNKSASSMPREIRRKSRVDKPSTSKPDTGHSGSGRIFKIRGYSPSSRSKVVSFKTSPENMSYSNNNAVSSAKSDFDFPDISVSPYICDSRRTTGSRVSLKQRQADECFDDLENEMSALLANRMKARDANLDNKLYHRWNYQRRNLSHSASNSDLENSSGHETERLHMLGHKEHMSAFKRYKPFQVVEADDQRSNSGDHHTSDWEKLSENLSFFSPRISESSVSLEMNQNNSHNNVCAEPYRVQGVRHTAFRGNQIVHYKERMKEMVNNFHETNATTQQPQPKLHELSREEIEEFLSDMRTPNPPTRRHSSNIYSQDSNQLLHADVTNTNCSDDEKLVKEKDCASDSSRNRCMHKSTKDTAITVSQRTPCKSDNRNDRSDLRNDDFETFVQRRHRVSGCHRVTFTDDNLLFPY